MVHSVECVRCGAFRCDRYALIALRRTEWSAPQLGAVSGYIRRNSGIFLKGEDVERLGSLPAPPVGEKAAQLLNEIARTYPQPGEIFLAPNWAVQTAFEKLKKYEGHDTLPDSILSDPDIEGLRWLGVTSAADADELRWLVYVFLDQQRLVESSSGSGHVTITPTGWQEIARLQEVNVRSRIGFVAMSFLPGFPPLLDHGIAPGIEAAGYRAERVDRTEHNNRIDDEISARIKQSRFLVADFTKQRGGIYFEAGYALGLGLPVIWLVRENALKKVHFDNRQYNFITWTEGAWDELRNRSRFRIESTIGRGPLAPP